MVSTFAVLAQTKCSSRIVEISNNLHMYKMSTLINKEFE